MKRKAKENCRYCGEQIEADDFWNDKLLEVDYNYMIEYIKQEISKAGTAKAFAAKIGFSPTFIADVLVGDRNLTDNLLWKLGFMRLDRFVRMK